MTPIIISEGDATGISYEIFDKSFPLIKKISKKRKIVFVQSQKTIQSKFQSQFKNILEHENFSNGIFLLYESFNPKDESKIILGKPSIYSGRSAYLSLQNSISLQKKMGANIITLPLSKEWVIRSGEKNFVGHTETFAKEYNKKTFMIMYSDTLKVCPMTTHIPLVKVPESLKNFSTLDFYKAIQNQKEFLKLPIGICGLNPHAGENGKMGNEEKIILKPLIKKLRNYGLQISDPIPADSIFIPEISKKFSLILACYHDQGLIPFKSLIGKKGINMTIGLDFIRVSPDHGTAFDIAGKNIASKDSLIECITTLDKL